MFKYGNILLRKSFTLALAASIAVTAAGCAGGSNTGSAPSDAPQAATEAAAAPADSAGAQSTSAAAADDNVSTAVAAAAATSETADSSAADATAAEIAAADTALKESVLSRALEECTGWGQSAGSSLRAAAASVMLLQWANEADAAKADPALLADTVKKEVRHLSDEQQENLKDNWSSISFDASMILDSFDEVSPILEDAGCAEAAKEISQNQDSLANWEALEHALDAALK